MTKYLYRKWGLTVTLAAALAPAGGAQIFRAPRPERTTPRAVAVLETFSNGVRRLVPVSFYYEHRYYDATFYRATPVPLSLDPGTVYEVEDSGKHVGTFTLQRAARVRSEWFAVGRFRKAPDDAALRKKAAAVVVRDPTLPVLHRRAGSQGDRPPPPSEQVASAPTPGENDPDRPHLHYSGEGSKARKALRKELAEAELPESATGGMTVPDSETKDSGRPILRRGKPTEVPGGGKSAEPAAQASEPLTVERRVAVSDAGPSQAQDVSYQCSAGERRRMEDEMRQLAEAELRRLAPMRGVPLAGFTDVAIRWRQERFALFTLDYSNNATGVFSARYRPASAAPDNRGWVVTIIARQQGERMVRLYGAVSDPRALGDYPELRLVDAVDPDGYGRYALLFRERKRDGVSWLLARASGYGLQTLFETPVR